MIQLCRFCLCQDEALLIPLEDMLDFDLAFQDVSVVTGIEINEDNIAAYAICLECTTELKRSVAFRNVCLGNESPFQELCAVLCASVKESYDETPDDTELPHSSDESQEFDLSIFGTVFVEPIPRLNQHITEEEEIWYSANCIKPGEVVLSEDENSNQSIDWEEFSLNPPAPTPVRHIRERGKRKFHLCDICGIMVGHIPSHVSAHIDEYKYSCPHCPVKTKKRSKLSDHIKTVHMKTVTKTCNICGKGFVHHKTYRYHMLNHQDAGKTFECVDCSKTFTNSIYLRDHINRLHNAGKLNKKKAAGERIPRKRNSFGCVVDKSD